MANNQSNYEASGNKSTGRQAWGSPTIEPSSYIPDHPYSHENRTGVGLSKTAINHCQSRSQNDPMRLTEDNAYHFKTMVSTTQPTSERSFLGTDTQPDGVTRIHTGNVNGQLGGAYVSDRGIGLRINTTYTPDDGKGFKKPK
ncbi:unnamed protein product [Adineta steineri]|uniref:Uncharacterized protein n=1 Tax=Adineta steineri TaxID=433720 RepID=A0A815T5S6_9BILA|nr:unnamed protein product [Adineta steineri]CAF1643166.1 unnamed protein product [Adineta steineri]